MRHLIIFALAMLAALAAATSCADDSDCLSGEACQVDVCCAAPAPCFSVGQITCSGTQVLTCAQDAEGCFYQTTATSSPPSISMDSPGTDDPLSSPVTMNFTPSGSDPVRTCTLYVDGSQMYATGGAGSDLRNTQLSTTQTLDPGRHTWLVNCTSDCSSSSNSDYFRVIGNKTTVSAHFCSSEMDVVKNDLYPLTAVAVFLFFAIIGLTYMGAHVMNDAKLFVWSKTEFIQLFISAFFVVILFSMITSFCSFSTSDIAGITAITSAPPQLSIYEGAEKYLVDAANYSRAAFITARYNMGAINMQETYSNYECPVALCFFSVGGTGVTRTPYAGASYLTSGFMLLMNSSLMSFFSSFMHIFFLSYVESGLFMFLLPIAIIARSMPYLRTFGGVILALMFAFYIIYPSVLALYYVSISPAMEADLTAKAAAGLPPDESQIESAGDAGSYLSGDYQLPAAAQTSSAAIVTVSEVSAKAFFYGTFLPTLALLTAIAATAYVGHLFGEEIDLSKMLQMV